MATLDFAAAIDGLLRRPLMAYHIRQLLALKDKAQYGELSEVDKIYIENTWNEFRSLQPAHDTRPDERDIAPGPLDSLRLAAELKNAEERIDKLREAGMLLLRQRDQLQARVKELEGQAAEARPEAGASDRRFEQAKRVFAKLYHPNALAGRSQLDIMVRGEVFKEFWAELERIEAGG